MKKTWFRLMLAGLLLLSVMFSSAYAGEGPGLVKSTVVAAIAWRADLAEGSRTDVLDALTALGVQYFVLEQVMYHGVPYDAEADKGRPTVSDGCAEASGMLKARYAQAIRADWRNSNVAEVVAARDFDMVIFTGGEDVSPSLGKSPDVERNAGEAYNATRDISDYILMSHCLENDLPVLAICRGMQMMGVVSGASVLQNIPAYYAQMGKVDRAYHRMPADSEHRDYVAHDVDILDRNSLLYALAQTDVIKNAPSWHHQSIRSVEGTPLIVTATTTCGGVEIIEAIERTDHSFALGLQFHPEASIAKDMRRDARVKNFTDKDESIAFFVRLVEYVVSLREAEDAA